MFGTTAYFEVLDELYIILCLRYKINTKSNTKSLKYINRRYSTCLYSIRVLNQGFKEFHYYMCTTSVV